jgi:hypothetical protein
MRVTKWSAALLCGMMLALPVVGQDDVSPKEPPPAQSVPPAADTEPAPTPPAPKKSDFGDPPLHRWGGFTISVAAWEPTLVGADEELATTYQNGIGSPVMEGSTDHIRETVVGIYHLPKDIGSIGITYDSMHQSDSVDDLTPGQFIFGETRAYPVALGVFDDGFADGLSASIDRKTREFRLYFSQTAFENPRAKGTWGVGYRQLSHSRNLSISYLAIVPNLPPLIPPSVPENFDPTPLTPLPDIVSQTAQFSGHGLGVTFDLEFPVHPRVSVISGLAIGLIRGSGSSAYSSESSYYFQLQDGVKVYLPPGPDDVNGLFTILSNGTEQQIAAVGQEKVVTGVSQSPTSQFAQSLDVYLGLEVNVYRGLKVFGTLRDVYYANVGEYVVPSPNFTNVRTTLSAGYEGYVLGLSWRY